MAACQVGHPLDFLACAEQAGSASTGRNGRGARDNETGAPAEALGGSTMPERGVVEKRGYTRFTINAPATVWREHDVVAGQVVDISLGGAFIKMPLPLRRFEAITLSVHDAARPAGLVGDLPATVVRTTETGCGIQFERMLLERGIGDFAGHRLAGLR